MQERVLKRCRLLRDSEKCPSVSLEGRVQIQATGEFLAVSAVRLEDEELAIFFTAIGAEIASHPGSDTRVSLQVSDSKLGQLAALALEYRFPSRLHHVSISNQPLPADVAATVGRALAASSDRLQTLTFDNTALTDDALGSVLGQLLPPDEGGRPLASVSLRGNPRLSADGVAHLLQFLCLPQVRCPCGELLGAVGKETSAHVCAGCSAVHSSSIWAVGGGGGEVSKTSSDLPAEDHSTPRSGCENVEGRGDGKVVDSGSRSVPCDLLDARGSRIACCGRLLGLSGAGGAAFECAACGSRVQVCAPSALRCGWALTSLVLDDVPLTAAAAALLSEAVRCHQTLTSLSLRNTNAFATPHLPSAFDPSSPLVINVSIQNIDLSENTIDACNVSHVSGMFSRLGFISVSLSKCGPLVGEVIKHMGVTCLQSVDVSHCALGASCVEALCFLAKRVLTLDVSHNDIPHRALACVAGALSGVTAPRCVNIAGNEDVEEAAYAFDELLRRHSNMVIKRSLDLSGTWHCMAGGVPGREDASYKVTGVVHNTATNSITGSIASKRAAVLLKGAFVPPQTLEATIYWPGGKTSTFRAGIVDPPAAREDTYFFMHALTRVHLSGELTNHYDSDSVGWMAIVVDPVKVLAPVPRLPVPKAGCRRAHSTGSADLGPFLVSSS